MSSTKKVQIRGGFSDRHKLQFFNTTIQLTDFDGRTKVAIINQIKDWIEEKSFYADREEFYRNLIQEAFCEFLSPNLENKIQYSKDNIFYDYIYTPIMKNSYEEVLSLVEYIANYFWDWEEHQVKNGYTGFWGNTNKYFKKMNQLFEKEYVGYRFIDGEITPISDEVEVSEIEQSLDIEFQGCRSHIKKALSFLSDREKPDYKNSIKESISAVESICKVIIGNNKATLGDALKVLESKRGLKGQLKSAFEKLYTYTNDKGGIRHAEGLFESNVTFEEAKYMLVSCCAFVNYLIAEYGKIK